MCKIKFEIEEPGSVEIKVVDVIGRLFVSYSNQYDTPGRYEVDFNDETLLPGKYYYRIFDLSPQLVNGENGSARRMIQSGTLDISGINQNSEVVTKSL
jgi:hypothetical protein